VAYPHINRLANLEIMRSFMSLYITITFEEVAKNEAEKTNRNTNAKVSYDYEGA